MENYTDLTNLIQEIEEGLHEKEQLLTENMLGGFKGLLSDAGDVAALLEKVSGQSPVASEQKPILDKAVNAVFKIYDISPEILTNLCQYSGFNELQIRALNESCLHKNLAKEKSICNLFESTALKISLIGYKKNRELLNGKKKNSAVNNLPQNGNSFDSFVRYLVNKGEPSVVLEQLARLDVYQQLHFQEELNKNFELQGIYNRYVTTSEISQADIIKAKIAIEFSILRNMREHPIQITKSSNGAYIASFSNNETIEYGFLGKCSPATYLDAWGVRDESLIAYCVTNDFNFGSQNSQVLRDAEAIQNGILTNQIPGITKYKLIGLCSPLISEHHKEYVNFSTQIEEMMRDNMLNKNDFMSLKYSPVNKELLKVVQNSSDSLYEKLIGNIHYGFHSDESPMIALKNKDTQISTSIQGITKAINVLAKIAEVNPTLDKIDTAFINYALELKDSYTLARQTLVNNPNEELSKSLDSAVEKLCDIHNCLISSNSNWENQFSINEANVIAVKNAKIKKNQIYNDQQESFLGNKVSDYEEAKYKTGRHNVTFFDNNGVLKDSTVSQIINGSYSEGKINQTLLIDCLLAVIDKLTNDYSSYAAENFPKIHQGSLNRLFTGLTQAINKNFELNEVVKAIDLCPQLKVGLTDLAQKNNSKLYKLLNQHEVVNKPKP